MAKEVREASETMESFEKLLTRAYDIKNTRIRIYELFKSFRYV